MVVSNASARQIDILPTVSWMQRYENIATSATVKVRKDKNFPAQLVKYVNTKDCKVAILNAFPYSAAEPEFHGEERTG